MKNNDTQLIQRTLDGDDSAFSELVEKYQKQVHALVWRKIGDFHIAEEITQDTFLRAYQKLGTLKKPQRFASWLYVIAANRCNTWLEKKHLRKQLLEDNDITQAEEATYSEYVLQEKERITAETQRDVVKKLLAKLGESERTVMTLHYFGEMSCAEIGVFMGVSANTVKSRLRRAQQRLQKEETMIREALDNFKITPNLTETIMQEISRTKPATPSGSKPIVPWIITASTVAVVLLMLGLGSNYLGIFQKPYSLDATAEMTVDIVDAPIVADLESAPNVQTQVGNANALGKRITPEQLNDTPVAVAEAQGDEIVKDYTKWELPKAAKARLGKGGIRSMQFSPDGRQLAVGSTIGMWLYDVKTGKEITMFAGRCHSLTFSPDGRFIASIGDFYTSQKPRLWDVTTGRRVELIDEFPAASALRFSADSKTLYSLSIWGDSISQIDVETGTGSVKHIERRTEGSRPIEYYALTHDKFAVGGLTGIELWDTTTGKMISTLQGRTQFLTLALSPDGTRIASGHNSYLPGHNDNKTPLLLWNTDSKESIPLDKHTGWVQALAFSSDGKKLASGSTDKMVLLWNTTTGELLKTFTGHTGGISALTFSPDNRTLASGSADGTVHFWNIETGDLLPTRITEHTMWMEAATATFFKDNRTLVNVTCDGVINLWNVKTSQKIGSQTLQRTNFHPSFIRTQNQYWLVASAFSPDGTKLISVGVEGDRTYSSNSTISVYRGLVRLSDVRTGRELHTLPTEGGASSVTFSPDGKTLAFGYPGGICLWNMETEELSDISVPDISLSYRNDNHTFKSKISTLVFAPDGRTIVSGTKGGKVQEWDVQNGVPLALLFAGDEPTVEGTPPNTHIGYQEDIKALTFSLNGNLLAMATNKRIRLVGLKEQSAFKEVPHSGSPEMLVFSPDNSVLLIGLSYGKIELWDVKTGDKLTTLDGHSRAVQTLVFSPDDKTLVSTGQDGTILVWEWDEVLKNIASLRD